MDCSPKHCWRLGLTRLTHNVCPGYKRCPGLTAAPRRATAPDHRGGPDMLHVPFTSPPAPGKMMPVGLSPSSPDTNCHPPPTPAPSLRARGSSHCCPSPPSSRLPPATSPPFLSPYPTWFQFCVCLLTAPARPWHFTCQSFIYTSQLCVNRAVAFWKGSYSMGKMKDINAGSWEERGTT